MRRLAFYAPLAPLLLAAALARAGEEATSGAVEVELVEGEKLKGDLVEIEAGEIRVRTAEGREERVRLADIVRLAPQEAAKDLPGEGSAGIEVLLVLRTGETLRGRLVVAATDAVVARTKSLGKITVPLKSLAGLAFGDGRSKGDLVALLARGEVGKKDRLYTASGDRIEGIVEGFSGDGLRFDSDLGKIPYRFEGLQAVAFGALAEAPKLPDRTYALARLDEGDLACDPAGIELGVLKLAALAGFECAAPLGAVREIAVRNGRLVHLSEVDPAKVETKSFIEGLPFVWDVRRDANALGRPLKLGSRTYERGLGTHAYTRLTYPLDGAYARFSALVGLDAEAAGPGSKASFQVLLDGETAFEAVLSRADAPRPVALDLAGAKELVLVVDFGPDGGDQGDVVDWADARLVKRR